MIIGNVSEQIYGNDNQESWEKEESMDQFKFEKGLKIVQYESLKTNRLNDSQDHLNIDDTIISKKEVDNKS